MYFFANICIKYVQKNTLDTTNTGCLYGGDSAGGQDVEDFFL